MVDVDHNTTTYLIPLTADGYGKQYLNRSQHKLYQVDHFHHLIQLDHSQLSKRLAI